MGELGLPWRLARPLRFLPPRLLDRLHDFVARHRRRLGGKGEHCRALSAAERGRFLDDPRALRPPSERGW